MKSQAVDKVKRVPRKQAGFSLIELLIVVAIILIIAAIAIPNFLRSRMAANEAAAAGACKKIVTAQVVYATTYGQGFTNTLGQLGPGGGGPPTAANADLLDSVLAGTRKHGYIFTYAPIDANGDSINENFTINADPIIPGQTGERHFFIDLSGVIRFRLGGPATATDPPIG